jgi:DNA-binding LytR/AlgR family response regulator
MKVLILEDEHPALERMTELLFLYDKTIEIVATFDSVKDMVLWLKSNPHTDLIFMDIQVADGLCFDIFNQIKVTSPVIFTTAYQEYAIQAFKVNSIDYLLKPIDFSELKTALEKFDKLFQAQKEIPVINDELILRVKKMLENPFKTRFVIKVGEHLRTVATNEILYFFSLDKTTHICTTENHSLIIDYSLDRIMEMIDKEKFFRINRKNIINREGIADIIMFSKSRLKVKLKTLTLEPLIVSRDKVNDFKNWLDG